MGEALGKRLAEMPRSLTTAGYASVDAAFPKGGGPDFESKRHMLRVVDAALVAKERGSRDAKDMTNYEKAVQKQKDYEKREEEHKAKMDKVFLAEEKARQRERERALERTSGKKKIKGE